MPRLLIELKTRHGFTSQGDDVALAIENHLVNAYGTHSNAVDAYLAHWEALDAGESAAEFGNDEWSRRWEEALQHANAPDNAEFEVRVG